MKFDCFFLQDVDTVEGVLLDSNDGISYHSKIFEYEGKFYRCYYDFLDIIGMQFNYDEDPEDGMIVCSEVTLEEKIEVRQVWEDVKE